MVRSGCVRQRLLFDWRVGGCPQNASARKGGPAPLLRKGIVCRPQKNVRRVFLSSPLLDYYAPGGLRQDPGHAASSSAEAQQPTKGGAMKEHAVVIAGGGPTGLMLAGELALAGVDVAIVDRRPNQELAGSRAGGLSSRTLEVLDQRGIVDRFLAEGQIAQVTGFAVVRLDISDFPTRHNYGLALRQKHIERILAGWVSELAVPIYRSRELTCFAQDDTGVTIELSDGASLRASYLAGCDGGRSLVRKAAGIEFRGWDATTSSILAEAEMGEEPPLGIHRTALGIHAFGREKYEIRDGKIVFANEGPIGVMVTEKNVAATAEPTL